MNEKTIKLGLDDIASRDNDVAKGISRLGYPAPRIRPPGFETLFNIIVSQQLSTHAATAIMGRVNKLLPELSAESIVNLPKEALRKCGLSGRKVEYAQGLDNKPTPKQAQEIIAHWSPWRSVGSLFLWHYYHGAPT